MSIILEEYGRTHISKWKSMWLNRVSKNELFKPEIICTNGGTNWQNTSEQQKKSWR
jgi:hypothetical protein